MRSATPDPDAWWPTDEGLGEDTDEELFADDVGIDGAAASAEEAAVHIIPDDDL